MAKDSLANQFSSFINKNLGINPDIKSTGGFSPITPWSDEGKDPFFKTPEILAERWNKVYPYRLLVIDVSKGNQIVNGGNGQTETENNFFQDGADYILQQFTVNSGSWVFELPITPQQLSITDQYAINTTPTFRGVVEEHNGVRFKTIDIAGTTGIWRNRPVKGGDSKTPSLLGTLLGGSLQAADQVLNSLTRVSSAFTGENPNKPTLNTAPLVGETGYEQALLLQSFLERYSLEKKKPENSGWRLVFDTPKTNQAYIVTPVSFSLTQSQAKPNERLFGLRLKAWKRVKINSRDEEVSNSPTTVDINYFQRALNTLTETRRLLSNSVNLLKAVRGDFQRPLEALRQTALAIKDVANITTTAGDLPKAIVNDYKFSIQNSINIASTAFNTRSSGKRRRDPVPANSSTTGVSADSFKFKSQAEKTSYAIDQISRQSELTEGMSLDLVQQGNLGQASADASTLANFNEVFDKAEEYFDFFNSIDLQSLTLTPQQREAIQDEVDRASLINIDQLRVFRADIQELALEISNVYGGGDELYSQIYNRPPPRKRIIPLSIEENEIIASLYEVLQVYDTLTATSLFDDIATTSPLQFIGGIARANEVPFDDSYTSKFLAPVPFGATIEQISAKYLGDANKWIEIASLNKLRSPYIDEDGYFYDLLSNASGRQFTVNDVERRLYVGQKITLQANDVPMFTRKIVSVERLSDEVFLVTVDGLSDLEKLTTNQNAKMRGYLAGTVNSQDLIYIPSNLPSIDDDRINVPKQYQEDELTKLSKVDWLLNDSGDVSIDSFGDVRLANGLTNLIQALKTKVLTRKGTILQNPEFGLGLTAGISTADIIAGDLIKEMNDLIRQDGRFKGLDNMSVRINGTTAQIILAVTLRNNLGILPITFEV